MQVESGNVSAFLSVHYDPVDRAIVAVPFGGGSLDPDVTWRLVVDGVRDLDDRPQAEPFTATFETGTDLGMLPSPPSARWADVAPLLATHCTGSRCHGPVAPVLGLDLSSAQGVRATAVGVAAEEEAGGTVGPSGAPGIAIGLGGLPRLDVIGGQGRPATSYLVYKILGDPHIVGDPMPATLPGETAQTLSADEIDLLSTWIRSGCPTERVARGAGALDRAGTSF